MVIQTSRNSFIGLQYRSSSLQSNSEVWSNDVVDIILKNQKRVKEEDVTIAIESSIHTMSLRKERIESSDEEDEDSGVDGNGEHEEKHGRGNRKIESANSNRLGRHKTLFQETIFTIKKRLGFNQDHIEEKDSDDDDEDGGDVKSIGGRRNGLFGNENSTQGWILNRYFRNETNNRNQKKTIAWIAWAVSFFGLLLTLTILTRDFLASTHETASTVQYESSPILDVPKIWFCTSDTQQPHFFKVPDGYHGQPLFWIDSLRGSRDNLDIVYPDTFQMPQIGFNMIGMKGNYCNASRVMDSEIFFDENYFRPPCFHCISIERTPALSIEQQEDSDDDSLTDFSSHLAFRLSYQSFLSQCRGAQNGMRQDTIKFFRDEMKQHSGGLEARGILKFGGLDAQDGANDGLLFPLYRAGGWNSSVDLFIFDVLDMFCNVYMFSGYFYPSKISDIRYEFDPFRFRWRRIGNGPYFPKAYSDFYSPFGQNLEDRKSNERRLGFEEYENRSVNVADALYIITNESQIGDAQTLAVLRPKQYASISFERSEVDGKEVYGTQIVETSFERGDIRSINFVYFVDLRFSDFFIRRVTQQQAMSWTAFLADIFGLTSLFLDISVYTLIISPISGRKAPGQQKSRKRRREKARRALLVGYNRS